MKEINVDEWFKGREDLEEIGDGVIEQLAKNVARLQDIDIAMTPLVDLLTGYTKYKVLQSKIDKAIELNENIRKKLLTCSSYEKDEVEDLLFEQLDILKEEK